jgi:large subunit ribosomal protein L30
MPQKIEEFTPLVVVRIRGTVSAQREARETLDLLRLTKTHRSILVPNNPCVLGMLRRVQSYVTWGEVSKDMLTDMISKRGRLAGDKKITEEYLSKIGCKSISELATSITECKLDYRTLPNIQAVFKLHPPKKGFKGTTKKNYRAGGEAGYRGEAINELIRRMI